MSKDIITLLDGFAQQAKERPLSLGEAFDALDQSAFSLISFILCLPYLQPIPLGPITVLGGIAFAALGWQLWRGQKSPVLPQKIRNITLNEKHWGQIAKVGAKVMRFSNKFCRRRMSHLFEAERGEKLAGFVLISAGLLMAIPFGVLPLNNVLPALAILFFCLGQINEDGYMVLISFFWLIFTVVYFAVFFLGIYYLGHSALNHIG